MTKEVTSTVKANQPVIIFLNEDNITTSFIDITCPMDINMIKNMAEEYKKYYTLKIEAVPPQEDPN
eukprot:2947780-Ditylum_brightwellii.AAC.1